MVSDEFGLNDEMGNNVGKRRLPKTTGKGSLSLETNDLSFSTDDLSFEPNDLKKKIVKRHHCFLY